MRRPVLISRAAALPFILVALLVLLAACGTTSSAGTQAGTQPSATDTSVPSAPTATATTGAPASGNAVNISDYQFSPDSLSVKVGTTVVWTNTTANTTHTVTSNSGAFNHTLSAGDTFSFTFKTAGTFDYHCSIHPFMTATITVTP